MDHKLFSQQVKTLSTVDVRFDKRSDLAILNQDCIDKYQENAYLLGRIFALEQQDNKMVDVDADAGMKVPVEDGSEEPDEADDADYDLGCLMNEVAA